MLVAAIAVTTVIPAPQVAATDTSRLVPLEPCRLVDTRNSGSPVVVNGRVDVLTRGRCGVPLDAVAVAVTVTSVRAPVPGWLAAFPTGTDWPGTSTVNVLRGEIIANGAIVRIGSGDSISVAVNAGGHVLVDVTAAFVPAGSARAGRFQPIDQRRLTDTRETTRPNPGGVVRVPLPVDVPSDAVALVVNLTTTRSSGHGYFTVYAADGDRPLASMLNTDRAGQTRAAGIIAPAAAAGIDVFTSAGDHVILDISGYFTGSSAADSGLGLFVPIDPTRLIDTRTNGPQIYPNGTRDVPVVDVVGTNAAALATNVTMTHANADGWMLASAARVPRPASSTVNATVGATLANMSVVPVSTAGVAVYSPTGAHVIVDVTGYFTGTPRPPTEPPGVNAPPGPGHTLFVSDSTGASLNYNAAARAQLTGTTFVLDLKSCRTTIGVSCPPHPPNAISAIQNANGDFQTLIIMTGYNDWHTRFAGAIDQVMAAARARGISQVVWLTLRTGRLPPAPGVLPSNPTNHERNNGHLHAGAARHADLVLIDWNAHSHGNPSWFTDDVHLSSAGAGALARFISTEIQRLV